MHKLSVGRLEGYVHAPARSYPCHIYIDAGGQAASTRLWGGLVAIGTPACDWISNRMQRLRASYGISRSAELKGRDVSDDDVAGEMVSMRTDDTRCMFCHTGPEGLDGTPHPTTLGLVNARDEPPRARVDACASVAGLLNESANSWAWPPRPCVFRHPPRGTNSPPNRSRTANRNGRQRSHREPPRRTEKHRRSLRTPTGFRHARPAGRVAHSITRRAGKLSAPVRHDRHRQLDPARPCRTHPSDLPGVGDPRRQARASRVATPCRAAAHECRLVRLDRAREAQRRPSTS